MAASPEVQVGFLAVMLLSVGHGALPQPNWNRKDKVPSRVAATSPRPRKTARRTRQPRMAFSASTPPPRRQLLLAAAGASGMLLPPGLPAAADEIVSTVLAAGDLASPLPQRAQTALVDYTLWIGGFEGKQIDTSKGTALPPRLPQPFKFAVGVGEVIPGWDRTVRQMHVGEKRRVVIPPALGYGEKGVGPIPGNADLYFEIELLELKPLPVFSAKQQEWLATHPDTTAPGGA